MCRNPIRGLLSQTLYQKSWENCGEKENTASASRGSRALKRLVIDLVTWRAIKPAESASIGVETKSLFAPLRAAWGPNREREVRWEIFVRVG